MIEVHDDLGREVVLSAPATRVVSLVPSLTEALFALGRGSSVIGVTRYCTEPAAALTAIVRVGGTKNPDLERIQGLRPDLVVVNAEENRRADFEVLERGGLVTFVSFPRRAADVESLLVRLGILTDTRAAAEAMGTDLKRTLTALETAKPAAPLRVFCPIWKNPWMSFNRETYAHDMLTIAGALNVCADHAERYGEVALDAIACARPDVILLPDEPYVFAPKDLPALDGLRDTPAVQNRRVRFIDGKALSWYGPRTATGLRYLCGLLR